MSDRGWQHPWLRVQRVIRSITQERWDREARTVMKVTLKDALKEREPDRRRAAGRPTRAMGRSGPAASP